MRTAELHQSIWAEAGGARIRTPAGHASSIPDHGIDPVAVALAAHEGRAPVVAAGLVADQELDLEAVDRVGVRAREPLDPGRRAPFVDRPGRFIADGEH